MPAILLAFCVCLGVPRDNPLDLAKKPGQRVEVWVGDAPPATSDDVPPMIRRLRGCLGEIKGKSLDELRKSVTGASQPAAAPANVSTPSSEPGVRLTIRIDGKAGRRDLLVTRQTAAEYTGTVVGEAKPTTIRLNAESFDRALGELDPYWGDFLETDRAQPSADPPPAPRRDGAGQPEDPESGDPTEPYRSPRLPAGVSGFDGVIELPRPYVQGRFRMDAKTLERVQGSKAMYAPTKRNLEEEKLFARPPKGYSPRYRPGLLIWMDPTPTGKPPWPLFQAADELNLVCIGAANAGNKRLVVDRFQLAFDALATAQRHWPIDTRRVYLIGVSGGGKMSSILLPSFPEVFTGAIPIVGLSWYESLPTGEGRTVWAHEYVKPSGARLEVFLTRRMAVVTGPNDFNYKPMLAGIKLFQRDKLPVRLFDIPGLGHEFPTPTRVAEAVKWVDESGQALFDEGEKRGGQLLDAVPAGGDSRSGALLGVIRAAPWTRAAWAAFDLLDREAGQDKTP